MATGKSPFSELKFHSQEEEIIHLADLKITPAIPSDLSYNLISFLDECLKTKPEERMNVYEL